MLYDFLVFRLTTAVQRGHALLEHVGGRVLQPGIRYSQNTVSRECVQFENLGGVIAAFVELRDGLMNRHAARAAVGDACGIAVPSGVNGGVCELHGELGWVRVEKGYKQRVQWDHSR